MTNHVDVSEQLNELAELLSADSGVSDGKLKEHIFRLGQSISPLNTDAVAMLIETATGDGSGVVRSWAVWALRDGGVECEPELCAQLALDDERTVRIATAQWIRKCGDSSLVSTLDVLSRDIEMSVRCEVAKACGLFEQASEVLNVLVADTNSTVRFFAIDSAVENCRKTVIPALVDLEPQLGWLSRRRVRAAIKALEQCQ